MISSKNQKIDENPTTSKESSAVGEPDEIEQIRPQNIYEKIYNLADKVAATSLGQYAIEKIDRILIIVEKTAKWSLPPKEPAEDKGIRAPPLERPCSWIPFLTLIIALRVARVGLSFGSILIGNEPVSPSNIVYFIQSRRRKLRAIKYHGLRVIRMKKQSQAGRKRYSVIGKLTSIFTMVICRPGLTNEPETQVVHKKTSPKTKRTKTTEENNILLYKDVLNSNEITTTQKRPLEKDDDDEDDYNSETDEELHVGKQLDKYAEAKTDSDDPDYVPEVKSDDSLSTGSELSDSEELRQKLKELKLKQEELFKNIEDKAESASSTNVVDKDTVKEVEKEVNSETLIHSEKNELPTSVVLNPTRMSSKIAQNGNAEDENFYDTLECGSDDIEQRKGSPQNFRHNIENNIAVNQNYNVKKIIQNRENCSKNTDTNNENLNENHVQPHSHQQTNFNHTKQHNNKKYYNNSNHNTYKYTKGRKIN